MKPAQLTSTLALTLLLAMTAVAQQTPNFAGKWTVIPDPAATAGPGGSAVHPGDAYDSAGRHQAGRHVDNNHSLDADGGVHEHVQA